MLTLTSKFGALVGAAALAVGMAGSAPAATIAWSVLPATSVANPLADVKAGKVIENNKNNTGARKGPWAPADVNVFTSVTKSGKNNGLAQYNFGKLQGTLSFVWGTPDTFNSVAFLRGGSVIDTIAGFGNGANIPLPTLLATKIGDGKGFDSVQFKSTGISFEYASLTTTALVPVPAAGLMLLTALGGVAVLRRRKSA